MSDVTLVIDTTSITVPDGMLRGMELMLSSLHTTVSVSLVHVQQPGEHGDNSHASCVRGVDRVADCKDRAATDR